jgi:ABC-type spermidine/putrescine transport system permease subunit I
MEHASRWRIGLWGLAGLALVIPLVAMQVTDGVNWGLGDFVIAALLLGGTGVALELVMRVLHTPSRRWLAAGAIILALLLIWAELAVGIFH